MRPVTVNEARMLLQVIELRAALLGQVLELPGPGESGLLQSTFEAIVLDVADTLGIDAGVEGKE